MNYVLVTGAFGGMGKETVKLLAQKGYTVFALDKKIENATNGVIPIECDVTSETSVQSAFEKVSAVTESLKGVIHFAGIYRLDSLVEMSEERFLQAFNVNLFGAYRINKAFFPLLNKGSRIIITTSELAPLDPLPFTGIYAVTKSALDKYAYSLRMEVQLKGVGVSVVRAGAVDTGLLSVSTAELDKFIENTKIYKCNAERFRNIVASVEAKKIPPKKLAEKVVKPLEVSRPKYVYNVNRNPLLLLLNALPKRLQNFVIRKILE